MFSQLQHEVLDRLALTDEYFKAIRRSKASPRAKAFAKGMVFIQLYAVYEFTVRGVTTGAIDAVTASGKAYLQLSPSLLGLMLDDHLKSVRECGPRRLWESRRNLFSTLHSADPITLLNTTFPIDGSHFRHGQLSTLFGIFGIDGLPARRRRHLFRIDEVVGHRNEIAHGRTTADDVGRSYTYSEIRKAIGQMRSVCLFLVARVGSHFSRSSNYCSP